MAEFEKDKNCENLEKNSPTVEVPKKNSESENVWESEMDILSFRDCPIHEAVAPIIWLHGTWRTGKGSGTFPNISPFTYSEQLQFTSVGQPGLSYTSFSWNAKNKIPMHQEAGFIRVQPGTDNVALMIGQNTGLAVLEEGKVQDQRIELNSTGISRMSFSKGSPVTQTKRVLTLRSDNELEQVFYMATTETPLTQHLWAVYRKVD